MPSNTAGSYRDVLALPYALRTFVPALVGRLAYGLLPLALLLTVQHATSSFAVAGAADAAFGLPSILMPAQARALDRFGQARVLPALALVCAGALAGIACLGTPPAAPGVLIALCLCAGVTAPALGPAMRASWSVVTASSRLKERAYMLDSLCEEALYLLGPLLVGVVITWRSPRAALTVAAALMLAGAAVMATAPPGRAVRASTRAAGKRAAGQRWDVGPVTLASVRRVVVTMLAVAVALSMAYTCVAATAQQRGRPGVAGFIQAGVGLGSVVGGVLWARRNHRRPRHQQLGALIALLAAGVVVGGAAAGSLLLVGAAMGLVGLAVAPLFVVAYLAMDSLAPPHQHTEASSWINVGNNIGSALGAALGGVVIDHTSPSAGFLVGGALLGSTALWVLASGRLLAGEQIR